MKVMISKFGRHFKKFLPITVWGVVALWGSLTCSHAANWEAEYARLLKKYVTPSGIRYASWKAEPADAAALQSVVDGIAIGKVPPGRKEALAFYLNAYNAWIIHEVLTKYPTKSVKDVLYTFFTNDRIMVAGEKSSFNHLEKDIIRPRFVEPRIHFALNCPSRSSPPLRGEPYEPARLDAQLEEQTRLYINRPLGAIVTKDGAAISKIFDWYKSDFPGGVPAFLNQYLNEPIAPNARLTFLEYDWSLNEAK